MFVPMKQEVEMTITEIYRQHLQEAKETAHRKWVESKYRDRAEWKRYLYFY